MQLRGGWGQGEADQVKLKYTMQTESPTTLARSQSQRERQARALAEAETEAAQQETTEAEAELVAVAAEMARLTAETGPISIATSWDHAKWDAFSKQHSGFNDEPEDWFKDNASYTSYRYGATDWIGVSKIVDLANHTSANEPPQQPGPVNFTETSTAKDHEFESELSRWVVCCSYIKSSGYGSDSGYMDSGAEVVNVVLVVDAAGQVLETAKDQEKASQELWLKYDPVGYPNGKFRHLC